MLVARQGSDHIGQLYCPRLVVVPHFLLYCLPNGYYNFFGHALLFFSAEDGRCLTSFDGERMMHVYPFTTSNCDSLSRRAPRFGVTYLPLVYV